MGDVIIPVLFIAIQISILGVYIRHKFKQLENEFKKMIKFFKKTEPTLISSCPYGEIRGFFVLK